MRASWTRICVALFALFVLFAISADAHPRDRGRGKRGTAVIIGGDRFDRRDRVRVIRRDRIFFPGTYRGSGRPPGWDRGRKVGWGNCDLPPGQAKKYGCRSGFFGRDRYPRTRPVIVIGGR
jgi:hypothetical protein